MRAAGAGHVPGEGEAVGEAGSPRQDAERGALRRVAVARVAVRRELPGLGL